MTMSTKWASIFVLVEWITFPIQAQVYQCKFYHEAADELIYSDKYPSPYPRDVNATWVWKVPAGRWGLVFKDFQLDSDDDWLEVRDRNKLLKFTTGLSPVGVYKTAGPEFVVNFISSGPNQSMSRGFQLQVLYGASDRELDSKIYEETHRERTDKGSKKEESTTWPLVIAGTSTVVVVTLLVVFVVLLKSRCRQGQDRDAFGVRKNSGKSHSRRSTRSNNEAQANDQQHSLSHQQQPQMQRNPTSLERSMSRSNSQRTWVARAELSTALMKSGHGSRPNTYLSKTGCPERNRCHDHQIAHSIDSSLNEYSETVDSIRYGDEHPGSQNSHVAAITDYPPPTYQESYMTPISIHRCFSEISSLPRNCYENVTENQTCPKNVYFGNQTNIYINNGQGTGNTGNGCNIVKSEGGDPSSLFKTTFADGASFIGDATMTSPSDILNNLDGTLVDLQQIREVSVSSPLIQIIDGYAFIIPPTSEHPADERSLDIHQKRVINSTFEHTGNNAGSPTANYSNVEPLAYSNLSNDG